MKQRVLTLAVAALLASCAGPVVLVPQPVAQAPQPTTLWPAAAPTVAQVSLPDLTSFLLARTDGGTRTPEFVSLDAAAEVLAGYDVVFLGEAHQHPGNHLAQMALLRAIYARAPALTLSMEQFERDVQPVVDEYLAGKIGETPFARRARAWGNYSTSYRPLVEFAKDQKLPVIAANAPENVIRCIGREGLKVFDRMKPEQRAWVAAVVNQQDGPYKDKFFGFVGTDAGHGGDGSKDEKAAARKPPSEQQLRSFAAQVTRDDTMAESIAKHIEKNPGRKVVHLNGSFHSDSFLGTVERLKMRMPNLKIAVVNPEFADDPNHPKVDDPKGGTFALIVRELPEFYANDAEMSEAIKRQMAQRSATKCEL